MAAASIASVLRNEVTQNQASAYFDRGFRHTYLRLLVIVSSLYDIIRKNQLSSETAQQQDAPPNLPGMEDLSKAGVDLRDQVAEEMTQILATSSAVLQDVESSSLHGETHEISMDSIFASLWNQLFSWSLPTEIGLYVLTKPKLGLGCVSEKVEEQASLQLVNS
jgi:hypothetical protein